MYTKAPTYVSINYKSILISSLNASEDNIKEARILTLEDISHLSGVDVGKLKFRK